MGIFVLSNLTLRSLEFRAFTLPRGRATLHAVPASVGIEHRRNEHYSWNGLKRGETPFVVIQHTLSGEGNLEFDGSRITINPGQTMLVRAPHAHHYFLTEGANWRFFFLMLVGQEVIRLADNILAHSGPVLTLSPSTIDRLAGNYISMFEVNDRLTGATSALAYQTMTILYDDVWENQLTNQTVRPDWFERVRTHIENQLELNLPIERLAVLAGMSRGHFVRQFTRQAGIAPSAYIFRLRMERAATLLSSSDLNVSEVARHCGYAEPNYFAKSFRKAFGTSPSTFRQSGIYTSTHTGKVAG